jgi:hypothetical protein
MTAPHPNDPRLITPAASAPGRDIVRTDPLTKVVSVHTYHEGKPLRAAERVLAAPPGPCVFCAISATSSSAAATSTDTASAPAHERPVLATTESFFAVDNRYSPLGEIGRGELVIPRSHRTSLEELDTSELVEMIELMYARHSEMRKELSHLLCMINVGQQRGSSQPHLHGQVVGTNELEYMTFSDTDVALDQALAYHYGTVITESDQSLTYAAPAPYTSGELRVAAGSVTELAHALGDLLNRLEQVYGPRSYTVVLHLGSTFLAQVLVFFTPRWMYPSFPGATTVAVDPVVFASALRAEVPGKN